MKTDWKAIAHRLKAEVSLAKIPAVVLQRLAGEPVGTRLGVACSGGADSVFMTLWLWAHFPERAKDWLIVHYNHRMRGEDSDLDEQFVRELALGLGINCEVEVCRADLAPDASEAVLREHRLSFFFQQNCSVIFQGHHQNDVAETLLMRLARGSGTEGLAAPRPVSSFETENTLFLRPLLELSRDTITAALERAGGRWRVDQSNLSEHYLRNKMRHTVIPVLEKALDRDFAQAAGRSRKLLEEDADALEALATQSLEDCSDGEELSLSELLALPRALLRRVVRQWFSQRALSGAALTAEAFEHLLEQIESSQPFQQSVGTEIWVEQRAGTVSLKKREISESWEPFVLPVGQALTLPPGKVIAAEQLSLTPALRSAILNGQVNPDEETYLALNEEKSPPTLRVRPWMPGDRYKPLGAPGERKLKDIFIDKKIKQTERSIRPIVCFNQDTLVWCPGLPPANHLKITSQTMSALRLTYRDVS